MFSGRFSPPHSGGVKGNDRMRVALAAVCLSLFIPAAAFAAIPKSTKTEVSAAKSKIQVADYYKGGKVCRKVGSATVCN